MGGGISQQEIINETTDMVSSIFVNIALYCNTSSVSNQVISINCTPATANPNGIYENNPACTTCLENVRDAQIAYYTDTKKLWERGDFPPQVQKPIDSDFQNVINQFIVCTTTFCKACNIQNQSQLNSITSTINCAAFNNIKNSITQQLITSVNQKLTNNQDMLAPLAEMLGASSYSEIVYNITNRINALITDNVIADISQQISSQQSLIYNVASVNSSASSQKSAYTSVQSYLQKTKIFNTIFSEADFTLLQTAINNQNTINSLGNSVTKAVGYLEKLVTNVVGKIVLFILILLGVVFIGLVLFIVTKLIQKQLKKQHDKDLAFKEQADVLPLYEQF